MGVSTESRKFKTYNALLQALRRNGVKDSGTTSTLLLEAFLENEGRLLASQVGALGLCEEGKFREWRKELIDKEWIKWNEIQMDKGQYFPGKKLINYINKEKLGQKEVATKDEVPSKAEFNTLKQELTDTKNRVTTIEESMKNVYSKLKLGEPDPPHYNKLKDKVIPKDEAN